jgi:predicted nucleic acid-binding protein
MADKLFVDTNLLLRATVVQFPDHLVIKPFIDSFIQQGDELWISGQVIREYFNQTTRPQAFMLPMGAAQIREQYAKLRAVFKVAQETIEVVDRFVELLQMYPTGGKQVHDANIVAVMLVYDIKTLLTLNRDDFKRFGDKITLISPP